jgi:hypothetical protein
MFSISKSYSLDEYVDVGIGGDHGYGFVPTLKPTAPNFIGARTK